MEDRHVINDMYYCGRLRPNAIVSVLTGNSYVVAEYDERSGSIRWQRVVNATQREGIHHWLRDHFPVKTTPVALAAPVASIAAKVLKHKALKQVTDKPAKGSTAGSKTAKSGKVAASVRGAKPLARVARTAGRVSRKPRAKAA